MAHWEYKEYTYISIVCITYNHSQYICQAIDGFLKQRTIYKFNIIIHDDCSNDETQDILIAYKNKYPNIIKLILQKENQYSKNKKPSKIAISASDAKYIALCEGDDYWIDELKIDTQVRELECNDKYKLCFTKASVLKDGLLIEKYDYGKEKKILNANEFIEIGGGACATNSIVFRKSIMDFMPLWYDAAPVGDAFVQAYGAIPDGVIYLPINTAVYRFLSNGSWSKRLTTNSKNIYLGLRKLEEYYCYFDRDTNYKYSHNINLMLGRKYLEAYCLSLKRYDFNRYLLFLIYASIRKLKINFFTILYKIIMDFLK
ncbi:glycosyltransferase [Edwardsiella tarda]|uniref:glycosyltransferase n=1 Tax=Edwardsiella tarda TaxID=636 RepID=UPI00351C6E4C